MADQTADLPHLGARAASPTWPRAPQAAGRRARPRVTLPGTDAGGAATGSATRTVRFLLAGPGRRHRPAARARSSGAIPTPGRVDHESDRCAHVEFADPALPWRYTPGGKPGAPGTGALHPWLVLVVGSKASELSSPATR